MRYARQIPHVDIISARRLQSLQFLMCAGAEEEMCSVTDALRPCPHVEKTQGSDFQTLLMQNSHC